MRPRVFPYLSRFCLSIVTYAASSSPFAELAESAKHLYMLGFRRQAIFSPLRSILSFPKVWGEAPLGVALPPLPRGCGGGVSPHIKRPCIRETPYIFYELLNRGGCVILVVNIGKTRREVQSRSGCFLREITNPVSLRRGSSFYQGDWV